MLSSAMLLVVLLLALTCQHAGAKLTENDLVIVIPTTDSRYPLVHASRPSRKVRNQCFGYVGRDGLGFI